MLTALNNPSKAALSLYVLEIVICKVLRLKEKKFLPKCKQSSKVGQFGSKKTFALCFVFLYVSNTPHGDT